MNGIRLSKEYGVNPSMVICFWCGKPRGEIALMGKLPGDQEAPREVILDYEPCEETAAQWKMGTVLIEVDEVPGWEGQIKMPVQGVDSDGMRGDVYPTGRWMVVRSETVTGDRMLFLDLESFSLLIAHAPKPNFDA